MLLKTLLCVAIVVTAVTSVNVKLGKRSTIYLPYSYQSGSPQFALKEDAVEQLAYDSNNKILYTTGKHVLHAIDVSDPDNMTVLSYLEYPGMEFTDVEFCGGHIFTALDNKTDRANGKAMIFTAHDTTTNEMQEILRIPVGATPDMVKPTSDCSKLVVAVEGRLHETSNKQVIDPPGLVVIITFPNGIGTDYDIVSLDFTHYNDIINQLSESGVRHVYQENNNPFSNDVEPEYIAINHDDTIAYVGLQENNAVVKIDLNTKTMSRVYGLGFKDWATSKIDPSDKDGGSNLNSYNILGMYQPDSIVHFQFKGDNYLVMANEGSDKRYREVRWREDTRGDELSPLELSNIDVVTKEKLANDTYLGRLKFSTSPAGKWPNGTLKNLYTFGGRSWSIRRADDLSLVYDSGDDLAQKTYAHQPDLFNCGIGSTKKEPYESFDTRSDNRGAEPEDVEVGVVEGVTLVFIANERPGTIMVYSLESDVTRPHFQDFYIGIPQTRGKSWLQMYNERVVSELDCEDMKFFPATESPTGKPVLFAAGSVSGTVSIIDVDVTTV